MNEQHQIGHVLQAFYGNAWLIDPAKFQAILQFLDVRAGGKLDPAEIQAAVAAGTTRPQSAYDSLRSRGVAVIPILGTMFHRTYGISEWSGGTSMQRAASRLDDAMADSQVTSIVLDIDSPGGTHEGTPEFARKVAEIAAGGTKSIIAIANGYAASAAYWVGSQAQKFYMLSSGEVGSIGVVMMHVDESGMDAMQGIRRTLLKSGRFKYEGHPYAPLSGETMQHDQQWLEEIHEEFVTAVAAGRHCTAEHVRAEFGQGRTVPSTQALPSGMVDGLATFDEVIGMLLDGSTRRIFTAAAASHDAIQAADQPAGTPGSNEEPNMSLKDLTLEQLKAERPDMVKSIEDGASAVLEQVHEESQAKAVAAAKAAATAEATASATKAERERCTAIIDAAAACELQDTAAQVMKDQIAGGADSSAAMLAFKDEKIRQLKAAQPAAVGPAPPDKGPEPKFDTTTPEGHVAAAEAYQKDHPGCSMTDALRACAPKKR